MVFLFVLISSLLKNTILFSWLIDGFPILKFYLIFSLFGCFFYIRAKSFFTFSFYNSRGKFVTQHLRDIKPVAQHSKVLKDVLFTRSLFKTNIVVPTYSNHPNDIWYLVTNDNTSYATKNYSYRFGSIEYIFKSQNLMVLDLNPLIPSLLNISSHYLLLCVLLLLGFLLLVLTILEIKKGIISKFVMFISVKVKSLLGIILFSILGLLFLICVITTM